MGSASSAGLLSRGGDGGAACLRSCRTVGRVDAMTSRKGPAAVVALGFALCLIALASAEPAAAETCDSPGLLGLVGTCSPENSATPRPSGKPTPPATPSPPAQPQPQPDPGATAPPAGGSIPTPELTGETEPTKVAPPVTTGAASPSTITAQPTPSAQNSASAAASRADPGGPAGNGQSVGPSVSLAGMLLAFGGALIAAGGVVGLRRYPQL